MFTSARIQLTAWYTLIIMTMTLCASALFYVRTSQVLEREYRRIEIRLQSHELDAQFRPPMPPDEFKFKRILPEDLNEARRLILIQLILTNLIIWALFAGFGYLLSGLTLKPIEEAHSQQRQFIADAAHELKTPITAMKTSLEVSLMDKKMPGTARKILTENLHDVSGLESLSESLLTLARAEEKNAVYASVECNDMVQSAINLLEPLARSKKTSFIFRTNLVNEAVRADKQQLTQAIVILLENALLYDNSKKPVEVFIDGDKTHLWIQVTDHGIGIDSEQLEHIFKRFYRVDPARNAAQKGHGLGLSVAQKIVTEHGGEIQVTSKLKHGSVFTIMLPRSIT